MQQVIGGGTGRGGMKRRSKIERREFDVLNGETREQNLICRVIAGEI